MASLRQIRLKNYKPFKTEQTMDIRPVTVIIGKNSSGKSSILKLLPLFQAATSGNMTAPLMLLNDGVSLGTRYEDLFHNNITSDLMLGASFDNGCRFDVTYAINNGQLFVYDYIVSKNGGATYSERASKDGFPILRGMTFETACKELNISADDMRLFTEYIGPIRINAPKEIYFEGESNLSSVGLQGEKAYQALLNSYLTDGKLFNEVSNWFDGNLEGQYLTFKPNGPSTGSYSLYVRHDNNFDVNIAQVGQGLGQVLPIIVASFMKGNMDVVAIEQPALHLHPAAHAQVAYRIAMSAKETGRKYLIESHSENFILGLRNIVANPDNDVRAEDIVIYFVDKDEDGAVLDRIEILPNGELTSWPTGIFSESFDLMSEIMSHAR